MAGLLWWEYLINIMFWVFIAKRILGNMMVKYDLKPILIGLFLPVLQIIIVINKNLSTGFPVAGGQLKPLFHGFVFLGETAQ